MKPEEAIKNIGDWISEETQKRKYDKLTVIELSDSLITLKKSIESKKSERRTLLELCLAYYIGALHEEDDGLLEKIPLMTDEELDRKIAMKGELIDWE